ncbi:MAG: hypothetical protein EXX96DRAFT_549067 [Benjaminiella poitrasii]|nr:MAG: hypothetical protein EXX96DRAFT_549067 [Benjaminiella poitrasii]
MNIFTEKTEQPMPSNNQAQQSTIIPHTSSIQAIDKNVPNVVSGQTGLPWLAHDANAEDFTLPQVAPEIAYNEREMNQNINAPNLSQQVSPPPKFMARPRIASVFGLPTRKRTIRKQIYSMKDGLDPVDTLCRRLTSWQVSIKYMISLFRNIKKVESSTGKGYQKIDANFDFPTKIRNQFKPSNGVQDAWMAFRQYSRENSLIHEDFVEFIENAIVPSLRTVLNDIRQKMQALKKNRALRTTVLYDCRKQVDKIITRYNTDIYSTLKKQGKANNHYVIAKRDPLLVKYVVIHTIRDMYKQENRLHQEFLKMQDEYRRFEQEKIINVYTQLFKHFDEYRIQNRLESLEGVTKAANIFSAIETDSEWTDFVHQHDNELVKPTAAFKDMNNLDFPNATHPIVQPLMLGYLNRHNGNNWRREYYILSPVGLLHRFNSEDDLLETPMSPEVTLFVPQCKALIDTANHLLNLKGKPLHGLFMKKKLFRLSSTDANDIQRWIQVIGPMAIQYETAVVNNTMNADTYPQQDNINAAPSVDNYNNNAYMQNNQGQIISNNNHNQLANLAHQDTFSNNNSSAYPSDDSNQVYNNISSNQAISSNINSREQPQQYDITAIQPITGHTDNAEYMNNNNINSAAFSSNPMDNNIAPGRNSAKHPPPINTINYKAQQEIPEGRHNNYYYHDQSLSANSDPMSNSFSSDSPVNTPTNTNTINNNTTTIPLVDSSYQKVPEYYKVNNQQAPPYGPIREGSDLFYDAAYNT